MCMSAQQGVPELPRRCLQKKKMKWWQQLGQSFNADGIRLFLYILAVSPDIGVAESHTLAHTWTALPGFSGGCHALSEHPTWPVDLRTAAVRFHSPLMSPHANIC